MQAYCEARGARFVFTIAPNKNSLYPEHMPARYLQSDSLGNYELVAKYLQEYGVNYADLFTFLSEQDEVLYLQDVYKRQAVSRIEYYHNSSWLEHGGAPDKAVRSAFVSALDSYLKQNNKYTKNESKVTFQDVLDSLCLLYTSRCV